MKAEDLVIDLSYAKKLKKLGVTQDSIFAYTNGTLSNKYVDMSDSSAYAAFTAQELAKKYPKEVWISVTDHSFKRREGVFYFVKQGDVFKVSLIMKKDNGDLLEIHREEDKKESNARAKMLIYLYEKNLMSL